MVSPHSSLEVGDLRAGDQDRDDVTRSSCIWLHGFSLACSISALLWPGPGWPTATAQQPRETRVCTAELAEHRVARMLVPFSLGTPSSPSPKYTLGTNLSNTQPRRGSCHMLSDGRGSLIAQRSEVNWRLGHKQEPQAQQQSHFVGDTWFVGLDTWSTYLVTTVFWSILALRSSFCCWRTWIFSSRIMFFSAWKRGSVRRPLAGPSDRKETSALGRLSRSALANYSV